MNAHCIIYVFENCVIGLFAVLSFESSSPKPVSSMQLVSDRRPSAFAAISSVGDNHQSLFNNSLDSSPQSTKWVFGLHGVGLCSVDRSPRSPKRSPGEQEKDGIAPDSTVTEESASASIFSDRSAPLSGFQQLYGDVAGEESAATTVDLPSSTAADAAGANTGLGRRVTVMLRDTPSHLIPPVSTLFRSIMSSTESSENDVFTDAYPIQESDDPKEEKDAESLKRKRGKKQHQEIMRLYLTQHVLGCEEHTIGAMEDVEATEEQLLAESTRLTGCRGTRHVLRRFRSFYGTEEGGGDDESPSRAANKQTRLSTARLPEPQRQPAANGIAPSPRKKSPTKSRKKRVNGKTDEMESGAESVQESGSEWEGDRRRSRRHKKRELGEEYVT